MKQALAVCLAAGMVVAASRDGQPDSGLDRAIRETLERERPDGGRAGGSIWSPGSVLADAACDVRAARVDDLVTVLVVERASALAKGSTKSARASSVKHSVAALGGLTRAAGPLANLAGTSGDSQLAGEGSTSRETVLSTTMAARVTQVLPNGNLVVEASKEVQVNSEKQAVTLRGLVRPADLSPGNVIRSDRIAYLEVRVNGKGVVGDAVRRPFFLYRLLMGLLPF
jgi:flagellar L-ring protein precursor FlgH